MALLAGVMSFGPVGYGFLSGELPGGERSTSVPILCPALQRGAGWVATRPRPGISVKALTADPRPRRGTAVELATGHDVLRQEFLKKWIVWQHAAHQRDAIASVLRHFQSEYIDWTAVLRTSVGVVVDMARRQLETSDLESAARVSRFVDYLEAHQNELAFRAQVDSATAEYVIRKAAGLGRPSKGESRLFIEFVEQLGTVGVIELGGLDAKRQVSDRWRSLSTRPDPPCHMAAPAQAWIRENFGSEADSPSLSYLLKSFRAVVRLRRRRPKSWPGYARSISGRTDALRPCRRRETATRRETPVVYELELGTGR